MAIDAREAQYHWDYFCSLCKRLDNTRQYVDHSSRDNELVNGNVNSFEFEQIIVLTAIEFENVGKIICSETDENFNRETANIISISQTILEKYNHITEVKIMTDYQLLIPLKDWCIKTNETTGRNYTDGIPWWRKYTGIKHDGYNKFSDATLKIAVDAMSSLMVLELYLSKIVLGNTQKECPYFYHEYKANRFLVGGKHLPDFQNPIPDSTDESEEN